MTTPVCMLGRFGVNARASPCGQGGPTAGAGAEHRSERFRGRVRARIARRWRTHSRCTPRGRPAHPRGRPASPRTRSARARRRRAEGGRDFRPCQRIAPCSMMPCSGAVSPPVPYPARRLGHDCQESRGGAVGRCRAVRPHHSTHRAAAQSLQAAGGSPGTYPVTPLTIFCFIQKNNELVRTRRRSSG